MAARHAFDSLFQVVIDVWIIENCFWMNADVVIDDELKPRQTDTVIRNLTEIEGQLRVADIHRDLQIDWRHLAALHFGHFSFQQTVIDAAGVAFGTTDRDQHAILELAGRIAATDHRGDAELACNDGCVAGSSAAICHDRTGALHHWLPVRVGHVGDQHVAWLHLVHILDVVNHADRSGSNFLTNGAPLGQHGTRALELVALLGLALGLAFDGLGPRLQDVNLAVDTVLAPLDVHGPAVVAFNDQCITRQLLNVRVAQ